MEVFYIGCVIFNLLPAPPHIHEKIHSRVANWNLDHSRTCRCTRVSYLIFIIILTMGAAIGTLLAAAGTAIASAWATISASAASAAVAAGLVAETYGFAVSAGTVGLLLGDVAAAGGTGIGLISTGAPVLASLLTGEAVTITTVYSLTTLGSSLIGLTATGALLGASYGIVKLALNSGRAFAAPTQISPVSILSGKLPCTLLDYQDDRLMQCRKGVGQQMRVANRQKRHNPVHDPQEEILLQGQPKQVQYSKRGPTKSSRLGKKVKRVRKQSSK